MSPAEPFWTAPGLRRASMQNSDLGRLNVVADADDADGGIIDDVGEEDELRRSNPELDTEAGDPGEDICPEMMR